LVPRFLNLCRDVASTDEADMEKKNLIGRSILLVEEKISDALDLQDSFTDAGARVVTAYRLERAMQLADRTSLSAAVIDLSQGTEHANALCQHLAKRKVPFVFYCDRMPPELGEWVDAPMISKPSHVNVIVEAVASLLAPNDVGSSAV
jgi:DNA-binding NtrC family response regulator